jgi:hypothetical protein
VGLSLQISRARCSGVSNAQASAVLPNQLQRLRAIMSSAQSRKGRGMIWNTVTRRQTPPDGDNRAAHQITSVAYR